MNLHHLFSVLIILLSAHVQTSTTVTNTPAAINYAELDENAYALLSNVKNKGKELEVLRNIANTENFTEYEKWNVAIKNDWLKAFLVYEAIEAKKFGFALRIFNEISTVSSEFKHISELNDEKYEFILLILERAVLNESSLTSKMKEDITDLRRAIVRKFRNLSLIDLGITENVVGAIKDKDLFILPYLAMIDIFIHSNIHKKLYFTEDALKAAVESGKSFLVGILLLNHSKLNHGKMDSALNELKKLNLYRCASTPAMIKQLIKFNVPLIHNSLTLRESHRHLISTRQHAQILNLLKISKKTDLDEYHKLYYDDDKMTVREAIMSGNFTYLAGMFLNEDIGVYEKDWFRLAIKFCGIRCVNTLLIERVPLLSKNELYAALTWVSADDAKALSNELERFSQYYNNGLCIDGPLGCDEAKYNAWKAGKNEKVTTIASNTKLEVLEADTADNGGGGSGGGGGATTISYESECKPLD